MTYETKQFINKKHNRLGKKNQIKKIKNYTKQKIQIFDENAILIINFEIK